MKTITETPAVVLITGALSGIGRATAIAFAKDGAHTVVSGRRDEDEVATPGFLRKELSR
jgi:NAD(P)-dependent dehydrogenase (short-subunit alcohol dehydrogenase family)